MLNETTLRMLKRHLDKNNSVTYICNCLGISRTTVYRLKTEGVDKYLDRHKDGPKRRAPKSSFGGVSYKVALPPEQWDGVKVLMGIIRQMQDMGAENPVIDLPSLRAAWQAKMNGVVGNAVQNQTSGPRQAD